MAPLIIFKRNSIEKNRSLANKLDANNPNNYGVFQKAYDSRNAYDSFNVLNNRKPEKQYYAVVAPDYVTVTYSFVVFTYYVEQLNKIVEAINYASDAYWGNPERFKFKVNIDSFSTVSELSENAERVVRATFTLKLFGYIIPDIPQRDLNATRKFSETTSVVFGLEATGGNLENFELNVQQTIKQGTGIANVIDSQNITNNTTIITGDIGNISEYLSINNQATATFVNLTTVDFPYGWIAAPTPLPATNADQFIFFVNGQLIEKTAIVSFTVTSGISTLIINPAALGFSFISTDEITGIGKFDI
jgi:hypothetical protein